MLDWPRSAVLYQYLHVLPVGDSANAAKAHTKGTKHLISPAKRQLLCYMAGVCAVDCAELEPRLRQALTEGLGARRAVPFLGDNNLFLERVELLTSDDLQVHWLDPSGPGGFPLTLWIDRAESSRTRTAHFRQQRGRAGRPPVGAWQEIGQA